MSYELESYFRVVVFAGVLLALLILEYAQPARRPSQSPGARWRANFSLGVINVIAPRLLLSTTALGFCVYCENRGWGVLNILNAPFWLGVMVTILAFDCLIYWQHRMFHKINVFWRFHSVHHVDRHMDLSTGLRFHPLEIVLSVLIKMAAIVLIGANSWGYLCFEVILSSFALFTHSNIHISPGKDRLLRSLVVTPNMHLTHHHRQGSHMNSNFGFSLSCWDRFFASYTPRIESSRCPQTLGVTGWDDEKNVVKLGGLLVLPFRIFNRQKTP